MISNKAILHTMTSIRLAGEVVNYLSKECLGAVQKAEPSYCLLRNEGN
jgi:hypothetical protein